MVTCPAGRAANTPAMKRDEVNHWSAWLSYLQYGLPSAPAQAHASLHAPPKKSSSEDSVATTRRAPGQCPVLQGICLKGIVIVSHHCQQIQSHRVHSLRRAGLSFAVRADGNPATAADRERRDAAAHCAHPLRRLPGRSGRSAQGSPAAGKARQLNIKTHTLREISRNEEPQQHKPAQEALPNSHESCNAKRGGAGRLTMATTPPVTPLSYLQAAPCMSTSEEWLCLKLRANNSHSVILNMCHGLGAAGRVRGQGSCALLAACTAQQRWLLS